MHLPQTLSRGNNDDLDRASPTDDLTDSSTTGRGVLHLAGRMNSEAATYMTISTNNRLEAFTSLIVRGGAMRSDERDGKATGGGQRRTARHRRFIVPRILAMDVNSRSRASERHLGADMPGQHDAAHQEAATDRREQGTRGDKVSG